VEKTPSRHADINIFTVASGMLYEVRTGRPVIRLHTDDTQRFASIMILSVLRNTNHSVKFWFIENFLSPAFLVRSSPVNMLFAAVISLLRNLYRNSRKSTTSSTSS
jgi:hypothetical protein